MRPTHRIAGRRQRGHQDHVRLPKRETGADARGITRGVFKQAVEPHAHPMHHAVALGVECEATRQLPQLLHPHRGDVDGLEPLRRREELRWLDDTHLRSGVAGVITLTLITGLSAPQNYTSGRCSSVSSEGWIRLAKLKPYTSCQVHTVGSGLPLSRDAAGCGSGVGLGLGLGLPSSTLICPSRARPCCKARWTRSRSKGRSGLARRGGAIDPSRGARSSA